MAITNNSTNMLDLASIPTTEQNGVLDLAGLKGLSFHENPNQPELTEKQKEEQRRKELQNFTIGHDEAVNLQQAQRSPEGKNYGNFKEYDDTSKYDFNQDLSRLYEGYTLNNLRGEQQPWYEQVGAGVVKAGVLAGTTFINGTLGTVFGLGSMVSERRGSAFWDNDFNRALMAINDWSEKQFANYYTKEEEEASWWENIFTANFLGDKFIKNLGFTIGAAYSGAAWSNIGKIFGAVGQATKAGAMTKAAVGTALSSANEASFEALHNSTDWFNSNKKDLDAQHYNIVTAITQMYGNTEQAKEELARENARYNKALDILSETRLKMGNADFLMNMAILMPSNLLQFSKLYSGGFNTARKALNIKGTASRYNANYASNLTKAGLAATSLKTAFVEGTEEVLQEVASRTAGLTYLNDAMDFYTLGKNPDSQASVIRVIKNLGEGFLNAAQDGSTWEQFFIGTLTGAMGMPTFGRKNNANAWLGKDKLIGLSGGAVGEGREYKRQMDYENKIVNYMNDRINSGKMAAEYKGLVRHQTLQGYMDATAQAGDEKSYKNGEYAQMVSDIITFDEAGKIDDLKEIIKEATEVNESDLDEIIKKTTTVTETSEKDETGNTIKIATGPFVDAKGNPMAKEDIIAKIQKNGQEMMQVVDDYVRIKNELESQSTRPLNQEEMQNALWLKLARDNRQKRKETLGSELKDYTKDKNLSEVDIVYDRIQESKNNIQKEIDNRTNSIKQIEDELADSALPEDAKIRLNNSKEKLQKEIDNLEKKKTGTKLNDIANYISDAFDMTYAEFEKQYAKVQPQTASKRIEALDKKIKSHFRNKSVHWYSSEERRQEGLIQAAKDVKPLEEERDKYVQEKNAYDNFLSWLQQLSSMDGAKFANAVLFSSQTYDVLRNIIKSDTSLTVDDKANLLQKINDIIELEDEQKGIDAQLNELLENPYYLMVHKGSLDKKALAEKQAVKMNIVITNLTNCKTVDDVRNALAQASQSEMSEDEVNQAVKHVLADTKIPKEVKTIINEFKKIDDLTNTSLDLFEGYKKQEKKASLVPTITSIQKNIVDESLKAKTYDELKNALLQMQNAEGVPTEVKALWNEFFVALNAIESSKPVVNFLAGASETPENFTKEELEKAAEEKTEGTLEEKAKEKKGPSPVKPVTKPAVIPGSKTPASSEIELNLEGFDFDTIVGIVSGTIINSNGDPNVVNQFVNINPAKIQGLNKEQQEAVKQVAIAVKDNIDNAAYITESVDESGDLESTSEETISDNVKDVKVTDDDATTGIPTTDKAESYQSVPRLRSWIYTKYNFNTLSGNERRAILNDDERALEMDKLSAFDFVDKGYLATIYQKKQSKSSAEARKLHIYTLTINDASFPTLSVKSDTADGGHVLLAIAVDNDYPEEARNDKSIVRIKGQDGLEYQIIGALSANKNDIANQAYKSIAHVVKSARQKALTIDSNNHGDYGAFISFDPATTLEISHFYSGRIVTSVGSEVEQEKSVLDILPKDAEGNFKVPAVSIHYTDNATINFNHLGSKPNDEIVMLNTHNKNSKSGSIWLRTREADGKYYLKGVQVKRLPEYDFSQKNPIVDGIKAQLKVLINPKSTDYQIGAARYILSQYILFPTSEGEVRDFASIDIHANDGKVTVFGEEITPDENDDVYIDRIISALQDSTRNLRFQTSVYMMQNDSEYLKDLIKSNILTTNLAMLHNVNASFELKVPMVENGELKESSPDEETKATTGPVRGSVVEGVTSHLTPIVTAQGNFFIDRTLNIVYKDKDKTPVSQKTADEVLFIKDIVDGKIAPVLALNTKKMYIGTYTGSTERFGVIGNKIYDLNSLEWKAYKEQLEEEIKAKEEQEKIATMQANIEKGMHIVTDPEEAQILIEQKMNPASSVESLPKQPKLETDKNSIVYKNQVPNLLKAIQLFNNPEHVSTVGDFCTAMGYTGNNVQFGIGLILALTDPEKLNLFNVSLNMLLLGDIMGGNKDLEEIFASKLYLNPNETVDENDKIFFKQLNSGKLEYEPTVFGPTPTIEINPSPEKLVTTYEITSSKDEMWKETTDKTVALERMKAMGYSVDASSADTPVDTAPEEKSVEPQVIVTKEGTFSTEESTPEQFAGVIDDTLRKIPTLGTWFNCIAVTQDELMSAMNIGDDGSVKEFLVELDKIRQKDSTIPDIRNIVTKEDFDQLINQLKCFYGL